IKTEESLMQFTERLIDRFGPIPKQVNDLLNTVRLRWLAKECGFEKIALRGGNMNAYFISNPASKYYESSVYQDIMHYILSHPKRTNVREVKDKLLLQILEVSTVTQALLLLKDMTHKA
ncbi:MAG: transcription-repair coupling factor, partial [Bacteroidales bacterium]|nr:transcription-repair coupling factor [Bacteroidales bacterium]